MDTLTAIRNFAKPGFSPAKRTRIRNDRYYLVTFQNVETDPRCDYVGLGEGEYVSLLAGREARQAREAHLNHCNRIQEYDGPVYRLTLHEYGHANGQAVLYASESEVENALAKFRTDEITWREAVRREGESHDTKAEAVEQGHAKSIMTPTHHREVAEECRKIVSNSPAWYHEIEHIR